MHDWHGERRDERDARAQVRRTLNAAQVTANCGSDVHSDADESVPIAVQRAEAERVEAGALKCVAKVLVEHPEQRAAQNTANVPTNSKFFTFRNKLSQPQQSILFGVG